MTLIKSPNNGLAPIHMTVVEVEYMTDGQSCKNYFKNGGNVPSPESYTIKFIEMINLIERNKQNSTTGISGPEIEK